MKIRLTLDEKYLDLVKDIMRDVVIDDVGYSYLVTKHSNLIDDLVHLWFSNTMRDSDKYRVIERIHSADVVEFIETKYNWRLKSEKVFNRYVWADCDGLNFCSADCADSDDIMTESEFKKLLEGTGLPFEAFEGVDIHEED